jgi:hypothetical protein
VPLQSSNIVVDADYVFIRVFRPQLQCQKVIVASHGREKILKRLNEIASVSNLALGLRVLDL